MELKDLIKQKAKEMSFREWYHAELIAKIIYQKLEAGELEPEQLEAEVEKEVNETSKTMTSFTNFILKTIKEDNRDSKFFKTIFREATIEALEEELFIQRLVFNKKS